MLTTFKEKFLTKLQKITKKKKYFCNKIGPSLTKMGQNLTKMAPNLTKNW